MKEFVKTEENDGLTRVFKYRLFPTSKQVTLLNSMLVDHCSLYNSALEDTITAWNTSQKNVTYYDQSKQLKGTRLANPEGLGRWSFSSEQQTLRRLHIARAAFFRRIKAGETPGSPRYKPISRFSTVSFINGDGGKWNESIKRVYILGIGHVKVNLHRATKGIAKQFSITREGKHWFVNVICVKIPKETRKPTGSIIGIDVGVTNLLADSNGNLYENPRHTRNNTGGLAKAQQELSRCVKGSTRWGKAKQKIANIHRNTVNQRRDNLHKLSHKLILENDFIVMEALKIPNMVKRAKPKKNSDGTYAPNGGAAKTGLNRVIHDAGWGLLRTMTLYKAENAGIEVILVTPEYSSQECYECEFVDPGNRNDEQFKCLSCGHRDHADVNASKVLLRRGLRLRENCLTAT